MNINIPGVSFTKPAPQAKAQKPKFAAEPEDSHYRYAVIFLYVYYILFAVRDVVVSVTVALLNSLQLKPFTPPFPSPLHYFTIFFTHSGGPSSARRGTDSPPPASNNNNNGNGLNLPFDELPAVGAAAMSYGQYNQESKSGKPY